MSAYRKEFCKNGHPRTPENVNSSGFCKICDREVSRKYYKTHKDKKKEYEESRKDKKKEYCTQYREIHKDKKKESDRKYREIHKDEIKEYREIHKDEIKEYNRKNAYNLSDSYIAQKIKLPVKLLREEMKNKLKEDVDIFEIKRKSILLTRQLRREQQ